MPMGTSSRESEGALKGPCSESYLIAWSASLITTQSAVYGLKAWSLSQTSAHAMIVVCVHSERC